MAQQPAPQRKVLTPQQIRQIILGNSVKLCQPVGPTQTINAPTFPFTTPQILNVVPRNVGLLLKFYIQATINITTAASSTGTRTQFGPSNFVSNFLLTDLNNNVRHNTDGKHMTLVASSRRRRAIGSAYTSDTPFGMGANFAPYYAPASLTASTAYALTMFWEVPVSYTDTDFRGIFYLGTTQANANLQVTFNPTMFAASGTDPLNVAYTFSGANPTINSIQLTSSQIYLDQLPQTPNGPLLPNQDMQTAYQLISSQPLTGLIANNQFNVPFTNFRTFMSTMLIYDNGGTFNPGTDITNIQLQAANTYVPWTKTPAIISWETRNEIGDDMPNGVYMFPSRMHPININAQGNMSLVVTPSTVNTNAMIIPYYEYFANSLTFAAGTSINP